MTHHKPIPQELLDKLVYDETSPTCLRWKERTNGRQPEDLRAGFLTTARNRSSVNWKGTHFLAHRLVWALHHGDPGALVVDHIDCDSKNNRIENLQCISFADNLTRRSGRGYRKRTDCSKYEAQIKRQGRVVCLGFFDTEEEARAAYVKAKKEVTEGLQVELD